MDKPKVVPITGNVSELKKLIEAMKRELPEQAEKYKVLMKYHRTKYDAAIGEGFTPDQALILCQTL